MDDVRGLLCGLNFIWWRCRKITVTSWGAACEHKPSWVTDVLCVCHPSSECPPFRTLSGDKGYEASALSLALWLHCHRIVGFRCAATVFMTRSNLFYNFKSFPHLQKNLTHANWFYRLMKVDLPLQLSPVLFVNMRTILRTLIWAQHLSVVTLLKCHPLFWLRQFA